MFEISPLHVRSPRCPTQVRSSGFSLPSRTLAAGQLVFGAKPRTPKGSSRTAQGASPGFKVQIAESPERAAQGVPSQLQINARHKAPLWCRDQLHRPFGASLVTVLVPRARALGSRSRFRKALKGRRRE